MNMNSVMPAEAKNNPYIINFILFSVIILCLFALVGFLLYKIKDKKILNNTITNKRNLKTKYSNVKNVSNIANLSKKEEKLLWSICKKNNLRNIEYLYKEIDELNEVFKNEYLNLINKNATNNLISCFFSLRYKLEKAYDRVSAIDSTKYLKPGNLLTYIDKKNEKWDFTIADVSKDNIIINIPENFFNIEDKPQSLDNINVYYKHKNQFTYSFSLKIIRYENKNENSYLLITTHASSYHILQRRKTKRMDLNKDCDFSAIKAIENGDDLKLEIKEKRYKGKLFDISATGCRLLCPFAIKKDQYINIYFKLLDNEEEEVSGIIIDTKLHHDKTSFVVHIKFINISEILANKIYAYIYNYIN